MQLRSRVVPQEDELGDRGGREGHGLAEGHLRPDAGHPVVRVRRAAGRTVSPAARPALVRAASTGTPRDPSPVTGVKRFFLRFEENLAALCLGGLLRDPLSPGLHPLHHQGSPVLDRGGRPLPLRLRGLPRLERGRQRADPRGDRLPRPPAAAAGPDWRSPCSSTWRVLFVLANLFYWGIRATLRQLNIPLVVLDIPYAWVYVVVPATALLMTIRTLAVMGEDVRATGTGTSLEPEVRGVVSRWSATSSPGSRWSRPACRSRSP